MRKTARILAVLILTGATAASTVPTVLAAAPATERYLHVRVNDSKEGESVSVNVPLSIAEKVLPTVNKGKLQNGMVHIDNADFNDVDIKGLLDAIRTTPDNEFVSVKQKDEDVRVAKSGGNLIIHVIQKDKDAEKVDITVPLKVVDALFSTSKNNEVDVAAALRMLSDAGDSLLVTVQSATQHVRIWVDSNGNPAE
jgi:hypothetical protein